MLDTEDNQIKSRNGAHKVVCGILDQCSKLNYLGKHTYLAYLEAYLEITVTPDHLAERILWGNTLPYQKNVSTLD